MKYLLAFALVLVAPTVSAATVSYSTFLSGSYATDGEADTQVNPGQFPLVDAVLDSSGTHYVEVDGINRVDSSNNFFFQNGGVATGYSSGSSSSILFASVTNASRISTDLRLDSQITPGHLAARNAGDASGQAQFNFGIQEYDPNGTPIGQQLYGVNATIDLSTLALTSSSESFYTLNGLNIKRVGHEIAYDWSATNIAIDLGTFAPGQTRLFQYQLSSGFFVGPLGESSDVPVCNGVQVSFGDPRTMGGAGGSAKAAARPSSSGGQGGPNATKCDPGRVNPFIGLPFGAYMGPLFNVALASDPLPTQPKPDAPVNYNLVPEPAALALFGLGALGLALARRRRG